jgi:hypothetical protein
MAPEYKFKMTLPTHYLRQTSFLASLFTTVNSHATLPLSENLTEAVWSYKRLLVNLKLKPTKVLLFDLNPLRLFPLIFGYVQIVM